MSRALGLTEDQLNGELYVAWLKDVRERPGPGALKKFKEVVEKCFRDREVVFRKQRIGVNVAITLSSMLAGSNVTKIDLYENGLRDTGCEAVAHLMREAPSLIHLNLGGNDIGSQGIQMLSSVVSSHKRLQVLILGSNDKDSHVNRIDTNCAKILLDSLVRCRTLKVLDLSRNPIGRISQEAFPLVATLLQTSTALQVLRLAGTEMQPDSGLLIAQAVGKCSTLSLIDMHDNFLTHHTADALGRILTDRGGKGTTHSLKTILLHDNGALGERGAAPLFKPLATDKSVAMINLSGCNVTDDGLLALCGSLLTNATLTSLSLSNNQLHEEGVIELARSVLKHPALSEINLAHNKVKNDGACALASMLETNSVVESLNLDTCGIGDRGIIAIGVALATNKSVTSIDLGNNHISEDGGTAFAALLEKNKSVQHCGLKGNSMFHSTMMSAMKIASRNKQLKQDEVPNKLKQDVIALHFQLYKLDEAKKELAAQQNAKAEADRKQERFEKQFKDQEEQYREEKKKLLETLKSQEESCKDLDNQVKTISDNFQKYTLSHQGDMALLEERYQAELKEREAAEEELRQLQLELANAAQIKEKSIKILKDKIVAAKEERVQWSEQTKELRGQYEAAQGRLRELEIQQQAQQSEAAAAAAAAAKPAGKESRPRRGNQRGQSDINALLGDG